ncbi:MAG: hypothetical protein GJT30_18685 [Geobacter sp.]|nr:hypothetical protein [Geobacter sp.]
MVFSRNCASRGRDSYPLIPDGPTTLEWLAGENIALRAKIEEQNTALQRQEEQIRACTAERDEAQQATKNYCARIAHELNTPIHQLKSRAEAMMSNFPASPEDNFQKNLVMLFDEIRQVTELFSTISKICTMNDSRE